MTQKIEARRFLKLILSSEYTWAIICGKKLSRIAIDCAVQEEVRCYFLHQNATGCLVA